MKNINLSKKQQILILAILILSILAFMFFPRIFESIKTNSTKTDYYAINTKTTDNEDFIYLSDIDYDPRQSRTAWGSIGKDITANGSKISVKVEGAYYTFDKGMWAHATSTLVYDISSYNYKYFTTYIGLNATAASSSNGVKFYIYTSTDGINWDLKTDENPEVMRAGVDSKFVKINIEGANYLKLYANDNGANGNDHSVYADAKLTNDESDGNLVMSVAELDNIIKTNYKDADLSNPDYELIVLQRNLIKNMGQYAITKFISESEENKETFYWLFNNLENLRLYTLGGKPDGNNYYNSLNVLKSILVKHKSDFDNDELTNYGTRYGDLYKKMAITLSLTHSTKVALWMQPNAPENQSDPVTRYEIYKMLHKEGKLVVTPTIDITKWFENYTIEEMRFVMNNLIDDEEILWLNEYTQSYIDQYPNRAWSYLTPHPYMAYVWPNYSNPVFHDSERKDYWDEKFNGIFSKYGVTYKNGLYKVWMNFRNEFGTGAVCGGISKTGTNIRASHGIPSAVIGQPGHAAIVYYTQDENGNGYWNIDNDVSGWTLSEKSERMLLGWGNDTYQRGYSVVYMALAQEVLNDFETFEKSQKLVMLADVYQDDLAHQEEIYREALRIQPLNINAWYGLINTYNSNTTKNENDYYKLAEEIAQNLKYFPLPMYHLTNLIKPKLTSVENTYLFTLLQTRTLTEGSATPNNTTDNYYVYQPSLTRLMANYLLGKIDNTIATFSFDGEDANKIVLSSRFDNTGVRWDYSLDGKNTWNTAYFSGEEEHKLELSKEEIAMITAENDIYVHIVGIDYDEENLYKIDITENTLPNNLYANDLENRVVGVTLNMEWRYNENDDWTSYYDASPNLTGDKTVIVRTSASKTSLPSNAATYTFTMDNQPETRKYITVANLSILEYSTESADSKRPFYAPNAIDGNLYTIWHTDFRENVLQQPTKPFLTIKLDEPKYISALEFIQTKYRADDPDYIKNMVVYISEDGENWIEAGRIENCSLDTELRTIDFDESVYGEYVKLEMDTYNMFASIAMVNLFEDATNNQNPTAGIGYSITEPTNQNVIARLVNLSSPNIVITSEGGDTHTFTDNGEFTFTFYDTETNKEGKAIAKVDWIDKITPTAEITYSLTNPTTKEVVATLVPNEEVTVLNNGIVNPDEENPNPSSNPFTYTFIKNGKFTFEFKDKAGNIGYATAKVDWIYEDVILVKPKIAYSTIDPTNKDVVATITFDGKAMITNNQGLNTYTFKDNGTFTFEYQDEFGKKGSVEAIVNNIDRTPPTAEVVYNTTSPTTEKVIVTLANVSEKVKILNNNGKAIYTFNENGAFEFKFQDAAGNIGSVIAKVDWITKKVEDNPNNSNNDNNDSSNNGNSWSSNNSTNTNNNNTPTTKPNNSDESINNSNNNQNNVENPPVINNDKDNNESSNNNVTDKEQESNVNSESKDSPNEIKDSKIIVIGAIGLISFIVLILLVRTIIRRKKFIKKITMNK